MSFRKASLAASIGSWLSPQGVYHSLTILVSNYCNDCHFLLLSTRAADWAILSTPLAVHHGHTIALQIVGEAASRASRQIE
jgi:hypothetical protein